MLTNRNVTPTDQTPVRGSGKSTVKPNFNYSEHFVTHVLAVDGNVWALDTRAGTGEKNEQLSFYSRPFTAEDDGEVLWQLRVSPYGSEFKVFLDIKSRPQGMPLFVYAEVLNDCASARKKDGYAPYSILLDSKGSCVLNVGYSKPEKLVRGFRNLFISLTYAKVLQPYPDKPLSLQQLSEANKFLLTVQPTTVSKDNLDSLTKAVAPVAKSNFIASGTYLVTRKA